MPNPAVTAFASGMKDTFNEMLNDGYRAAEIDDDSASQYMQYKMYKGNQEYNERQAEKNRQFMEYYYNKYDSPEAMIRQYRDAGLNPFSYSGQVGSISSHMGTEQYLNPSDAFNLGNQSLQRQSLKQ